MRLVSLVQRLEHGLAARAELIQHLEHGVALLGVAGAGQVGHDDQQIREHRISGYSESVRRCVTFIEFHYAEYLSLQALSDELHLNAPYLSAQFKKETGHTVTEYISYTRIKHALPLLAQSTRSVEDIAATCGFDDMNYFARVFRKVMNMSPTVYRKQARVLKMY